MVKILVIALGLSVGLVSLGIGISEANALIPIW
jgi:hypothetical protein